MRIGVWGAGARRLVVALGLGVTVLVGVPAAAQDDASRSADSPRPNPHGPPRHGGDPAFLTLGSGLFDITDEKTTGLFRLEYRSDRKIFFLRPLFGMEINLDGGFYGYFGLQTDLFFGNRWVLTPTAAVGGYAQGNSRDLGYGLEFRTGGELAYRFEDRSRIGLAVHHISNANIGAKNPGVENITINYSIPFNRLMSLVP